MFIINLFFCFNIINISIDHIQRLSNNLKKNILIGFPWIPYT